MMADSTALIVAMVLILSVAVFGQSLDGIRRAYYMGIGVWSRWLPVAATGVFLAVLAANIASGESASERMLGLSSFFSVTEMVVLFLVGPLFLTRMGNLLAGATIAYCLERLLSGDSGQSGFGVYLILGSATVVAALADKMPWISAAGGAVVMAQKLREIVLAAITIAALAIVFAATMKVHTLAKWLSGNLDLVIPSSVLMLVLVTVFTGWLSVALGFTRYFTLPLLILPTLLATIFITGVRGELLVVPFVLCLAFSVATADRRLLTHRRNSPTPVLLPR